MKFLFEYLTDSFSLLENPITDLIVMTFIGTIAFSIAYKYVGDLYRFGMIGSRESGRVLHWIIRFVVFVVIFYGSATAIRIYKWFHVLPSYKWWIMGAIVVSVMAIVLIVRYLINRRVKAE